MMQIMKLVEYKHLLVNLKTIKQKTRRRNKKTKATISKFERKK